MTELNPHPAPRSDEPFVAGGETPILAERADLAAPTSVWKRIRFLTKVVEIRLRFILVVVATFILIGKWDVIKNLWDKWTRPASVAAVHQSDVEYFCPMHPTVVRDSLEPDGSIPKCPICSMPLSKRKKGEAVKLPDRVLARVELSAERRQMGGIATAPAEYRRLSKQIQTVGTVQYDETRQSQIVARTAGFIDKLYVDKSYESVGKGEPLAMLYSPDLSSTAADLMLALDRGAADLVESGKERLRLLGVGDNEIQEIVASRQLLVALKRNDQGAFKAAVAKLQKLGMTDAEIDDIKTTRNAPSGLVIRSPVSGHVINKQIVQGSRVDAGMTLFDVADLSHAWVEADVFEGDIPLLRPGQDVEVTLEGQPNQVFRGQILLVHPHVEMATRTDRVRIDLPNPGHVLRPGMYATVKINVPLYEIEPYKTALAASKGPVGTDDASLIAFQKTCPVRGNKLGSMGPPVKLAVQNTTVFLCCPACVDDFNKDQKRFLAALAAPPANEVLTVPEAAVIDTGAKKIVYVEREPGVFDGIEVEVGPVVNGVYPIIKGLRAGERVAAAGAFLVDAETRLNPAAGAAYIGASGGPTAGGGPSSVVAPASGTVRRGSPDPAEAPTEGLPPHQETSGPARGTVGDRPQSQEPLAAPDADELKNINLLPPEDRAAALAQRNCPITRQALGSMGVPVKVELASGKTAFLCCPGCRDEALKDPQKTIAKLAEIRALVEKQIKAN